MEYVNPNSVPLNTLKALKTPKTGKTLAKVLLGIGAMFLVMMFLPWQQNIRGTGTLTAFTPSNRPQMIESTIAGRITSWRIREGQFVQQGDTILTLSEIKDEYFDPELLERIDDQVDAKSSSIQSKEEKAVALRTQIAALRDAFQVKDLQIRNKIRQAELKLVSDSVDFEAEKIRFRNLENQFERNKILFEAGNIALTKFQEIESKLQEARMKVVTAENKFQQSKAELINTKADIAGIRAEYQDKISKTESDLNATLADLYEAEGSLAKLENYYVNVEIRREQYQVIAPQAGYLVKTLQAGIGETIKEGEAVATVVPANPDLAVEIYVQAMDVPLISTGSKVRIEFDGWPALQFSGWPSVSVGSFGGIVQVVDYMNSQGGQFRILVTPDPEDEPWPEQLRLGSGAKGWVMLNNVPVWYEIWRQLNGFPPSLYEEPLSNSATKSEEEAKK